MSRNGSKSLENSVFVLYKIITSKDGVSSAKKTDLYFILFISKIVNHLYKSERKDDLKKKFEVH